MSTPIELLGIQVCDIMKLYYFLIQTDWCLFVYYGLMRCANVFGTVLVIVLDIIVLFTRFASVSIH